MAAQYAAELRKTTHLADLARDATLDGVPWARDASEYDARQYGGPGFLLVGDAATFIDPLSSFGVKKALASAWLAAVATNTCLRSPAREALALQLYAEREQQVFDSYRRQTATYFSDMSATHPHPFWTDRADVLDLDRRERGDEVDSLRRNPAVLAAFEALRQARSIRLRPTDRLRTRTAPAVFGWEIIPEERLSFDDPTADPSGIRFLRGVDLVTLASMAANHTQVPDLFEAYQRVCSPVALPDFLGALAVLLAKGVLRNET